MSEIKNNKLDFIERTKEILKKHYDRFKEDNREVTFLLNCLLGLIVAISENEKSKNSNVFNGRFDEDVYKLIPKQLGFIDTKNDELNAKLENGLLEEKEINIKYKVNNKKDLKRYDLKMILEKIRNAIAHQNIIIISENDKCIGIRLWNKNKNIKDFEIIFKIEELRIFAIAVADKYLTIQKLANSNKA